MTQQTDEYTTKDTYIYESPDGGKTVRRRLARGTHVTSLDVGIMPGSLEDKDWFAERHQKILEDQMWHEIRNMSKSNEGLRDILNQAIILHRLLKDEQ